MRKTTSARAWIAGSIAWRHLAHTLPVVVTDEPTSVTDADAVLKLREAETPGGDVRVV